MSCARIAGIRYWNDDNVLIDGPARLSWLCCRPGIGGTLKSLCAVGSEMQRFAAAVTKVLASDSLEFLLLILIPSAESAESRGKGSLISILCLSSLMLLVASYLFVMVTSCSVFNCAMSTISCKFSCALPSDAMTSACRDTAIMSSSCFARSSPDRSSWLYRPRARCSSRNWRMTMAPPSSKEVCSMSCTTA